MSGKILFPTDYSEASNAALPFAMTLARQTSASLHVLHVESDGPSQVSSDREERAALVAFLDLSKSSSEPVENTLQTLAGNVIDEIMRVAREEQVDLIVMATAGRTGIGRLIIGSVAQAVMRKADCPVLTIKQPLVVVDSDAARNDLNIEASAELSALKLLRRSVAARATDVHLDPSTNGTEVHFRVDGQLEKFCELPAEVAHPLLTQLKVMAQLDIANPFPPQEGQLELPEPLSGQAVRLTRVRVVGGESIALRFHSRNRLIRPLETLGFSMRSCAHLQEMLRRGEGIVLVTGPTGSGKTTTAYSLVHALDDGTRKIVTIEDPPEYHVPGFRQMVADVRHGITMASGLKNLLRMDPDLLIVGEIRDAETAQVAIRAAASGKYVFTTLHARDAAATITALRDLRLDDRSLAANVTGIISQRLVRRVCPCCRELTPISKPAIEQFEDHGLVPPEFLPRAVGCPHCRQRGFHERIGVFEVVLLTRAIRDAVAHGAEEDELRDLLRSQGTRSLVSDGLVKVANWQSTLEEINSMTWAEGWHAKTTIEKEALT